MLGNVYDKTDEMYGEGDAMVVDTEGYAKIVRHLAAHTFIGGEHDPRLLLRETVSEVHLSTADDECSTDCGVYVLTAEGHEYSAQYAIITFSVQPVFSMQVYSVQYVSLPSTHRSTLFMSSQSKYTVL